MKFDYIIMNPPYSRDLHLKILKRALNYKKDNGTLICLHPARWLEDPLWKYKKNSDHAKYQETIIDKLSSVKLLRKVDCANIFNIWFTFDLMISCFSNSKLEIIPSILSVTQQNILEKVSKYSLTNNIKSHIEFDKTEGWRIKVCRIMHGAPQNCERLDRANIYYSTDVPLLNGYSKKGLYWTSLTSQSKDKTAIPASIKFYSEDEAANYLNSLKTNFIKNYIMIVMWGVNVPYFIIPWMADYSHIWTDADYCKFFKLTKEESEFMCRNVEDYRIKDYIKYEEISD